MLNVLTVSLLFLSLYIAFPGPFLSFFNLILLRLSFLLSLLTRLSSHAFLRPSSTAATYTSSSARQHAVRAVRSSRARAIVRYAYNGVKSSARLQDRLRATPVRWTPLPIGIGIGVLIGLNAYKQRARDRRTLGPDGEPQVKGPWQVYVIGALPLRTISRIYGALNSYTLPVWFRTPGYKLFSWVFGVNLDECEPSDLREYRSLSEFFQRKLKAGVRPIAPSALVSPADGRVVNFGVIENRRVASVKGMSYSLDALLQGAGAAPPVSKDKSVKSSNPTMTNVTTAEPETIDGRPSGVPSIVNERDFANVNGIEYSLDELIGGDASASKPNTPMYENGPNRLGEKVDASVGEKEQKEESDEGRISNRLIDHASVAANVGLNDKGGAYTFRGVPKEGNKMFFSVIYLAPGDYHRFHSPTSWVVERRRHFAGELFSVSPWMLSKLADLFVLNERVALLGRWRHGFFSMIPVGATNVGSIRVNFDKELRTNHPQRPITPGTFAEATYKNASLILNGQPLRPGDEMGGFWLGSTIVLVFEAPANFEFKVENGQKVQMGQPLGELA